MHGKTITSEILVAYSQCHRKAFLLLFSEEDSFAHEYITILGQKRIKNRLKYIATLKQKNFNIGIYNEDNRRKGYDYLIDSNLKSNELEAFCDLLVKVEGSSSVGKYSYEPIIITGTHIPTKEQKIELFFASYILEKIQNRTPSIGCILSVDKQIHRLRLKTLNVYNIIEPFILPLKGWIKRLPSKPPAVILNKHCPYCQFHASCREKAEKTDDLSLLDRMTTKTINKYHKKGIFTVTQLSYLFKPRRRNKKTKKPIIKHNLELQALAIRTEKTYIQDLLELTRKPVELFLDIEGIPDQNFYYLVGLLVCERDNIFYYPFWINSISDEEKTWIQVLKKLNEYPGCYIYHYGNYELKAIEHIEKKYLFNCQLIREKLININAYIYGRIYFPVTSNSLKNIGKFIGASWSSLGASGLQSLVWRHYWEETRDNKYQKMLIIYNEEDCRALKLLTDKISKIRETADLCSDVNFADLPKKISTEIGDKIHNQFQAVLQFARADYDKNKIIRPVPK